MTRDVETLRLQEKVQFSNETWHWRTSAAVPLSRVTPPILLLARALATFEKD
jgi:hypothetical protein